MSAERRHCRLLLLLPLLVLLGGCGDPGTGPVAVKWDRDACERCRMVLSDRSHAAEIRYFASGKQRSSVALFDDIGCALIWLEQQPWREDPRTEIWVIDRQTGDWIDARKASYVSGHQTAMDYGLAAQAAPAPDGLDFARAKAYIDEQEQRFNVHGQALLERLLQQAEARDSAPGGNHPADNLPPITQGAR